MLQGEDEWGKTETWRGMGEGEDVEKRQSEWAVKLERQSGNSNGQQWSGT